MAARVRCCPSLGDGSAGRRAVMLSVGPPRRTLTATPSSSISAAAEQQRREGDPDWLTWNSGAGASLAASPAAAPAAGPGASPAPISRWWKVTASRPARAWCSAHGRVQPRLQLGCRQPRRDGATGEADRSASPAIPRRSRPAIFVGQPRPDTRRRNPPSVQPVVNHATNLPGSGRPARPVSRRRPAAGVLTRPPKLGRSLGRQRLRQALAGMVQRDITVPTGHRAIAAID